MQLLEKKLIDARPSLWLVAPFLVTLALRLALLGAPPFTDDGYYVAMSKHTSLFEASVPASPLGLYSGISGVLLPQLDSVPFLLPRLLDAVVAGLAALAFALLLSRLTYSSLAIATATLWALLINHPSLIDAGFKNPLFPFYLCLFVSLWLLTFKNSSALFLSGLLAGLAVVFREPAILSSVAVLVWAYMFQGYRGARLVFLGLLASAISLLLWISLFKGGVWLVLSNYSSMASMFSSLGERYGTSWMGRNLRAFFELYYPLIIVSGILFLVLGILKKWRELALICSLLFFPFPDLLGKIFYPYHLGQFLFVLCLLLAFASREIKRPRISGLGIALLGFGSLITGYGAWQQSINRATDFAPVMMSGNWESPVVEESMYLSQARHLRLKAKPEDTLLVSRFAYTLFALTNLKPASPGLFDLSFLSMGKQVKDFADLGQTPDFFIESYFIKGQMDSLWAGFSDRYSLSRDFPKKPAIHYGAFAAKVWELQ